MKRAAAQITCGAPMLVLSLSRDEQISKSLPLPQWKNLQENLAFFRFWVYGDDS